MKLAAGSVLALFLISSPAAFARGKDVTCTDGTTSKSGRGACSGHGGVSKGGAAAPAAPKASGGAAATPAPSAPATPAPSRSAGKAARGGTTEGPDANSAGATAKCKDGSFSHSKGHSGACSRHGGVAQWLDGSK